MAKSAGKKSSSGKKPQEVAVTLESMTREQLLEEAKKLNTEITKEREERNFFMIERDRVLSYWEISKYELRESEALLLNKDRLLEEMEEKHQVEIKVYKQKVKHLLYEYQNNVENLQTVHAEALNIASKGYDEDQEHLKQDKRQLKLQIREMELAHEDVVRNLKSRHDAEINAMRLDFESRAKELQTKFESKMKKTREDTELRRKNEIHEIEERKNNQINVLMKNHEKAFSEIKNYYNDITLNNLALINSLKEQVEEMKKKEERHEKLMADITMENKRLSEPLQAALTEGETLRKQLLNYKKDKLALVNTQARLKALMESQKNVVWEHDILQQEFSKVQLERNELYSDFVGKVTEVQQKTGLKNLVLEKKLDTLKSSLEKRELQLNQVLSANCEKNQKLVDQQFDQKQNQIRELQMELAKLTKSYNNLLRCFEAKMAEHDLSFDFYIK